MDSVFPMKSNPVYFSKQIFVTRNVRTVNYGLETISVLGPKIWSIVPDNLKMFTTVADFKKHTRSWKPIHCPCRICKVYARGVGYVNLQN